MSPEAEPQIITRVLEAAQQISDKLAVIEGRSDSPSGVLRFEIGRSSAGGDEVSIRRVGEGDPLPHGPVRWFFRPTLAELTTLLVTAQRLVGRGIAASLFDALLDLDREESA